MPVSSRKKHCWKAAEWASPAIRRERGVEEEGRPWRWHRGLLLSVPWPPHRASSHTDVSATGRAVLGGVGHPKLLAEAEAAEVGTMDYGVESRGKGLQQGTPKTIGTPFLGAKPRMDPQEFLPLLQ